MEFAVPKDCVDSSFHKKWRLFLLDFVKEWQFDHLQKKVKDALKKFLDHPTSLPYEESKIENFLRNSMIIVDDDVMTEALSWFKVGRDQFFEKTGECGIGYDRGRFRRPPLNKTDDQKKLEVELPKKKGTKYELILVNVPTFWTCAKLTRLLKGEVHPDKDIRVQRLNTKLPTLTFLIQSEIPEDSILILNSEDDLADSIIDHTQENATQPQPRFFLTPDSCASLNVVAVECATKGAKFPSDSVRELRSNVKKFGTIWGINLFNNLDGFMVVFESPEGVKTLLEVGLPHVVVGDIQYLVKLKGL